MWIALLLAGIVGGIFTVRALRHASNGPNILIQNYLPETSEQPEKCDQELQMELLLLDLASSSRRLADALTLEADCGEKAFAEPSDQTHFSKWQEARRSVLEAQQIYSQTVEEYGRFVEQLSPTARPDATSWLVRAMSAIHA